MKSPVLYLWAFISVLVAGTCTFSFVQPFWFIQADYVFSFGVLNYCMKLAPPTESVNDECRLYGGYFHISNVPSGAWKATCVLYGGGCVLICIGSVLAVCDLFLPEDYTKKVSILAGNVQLIAVALMTIGLFVYPFGLESNLFRYYCGDSASSYDSASCHIGWSFMLGIMGTALSMFCPFLAHFTDITAKELFV